MPNPLRPDEATPTEIGLHLDTLAAQLLANNPTSPSPFVPDNQPYSVDWSRTHYVRATDLTEEITPTLEEDSLMPIQDQANEISLHCREHYTAFVNSINDNPFRIDCDWWWIYEQDHRQDAHTTHLTESYCSNTLRSSRDAFIRRYIMASEGEREGYGPVSYSFRDRRGGPLVPNAAYNRKSFRAAARSLLYICRRLKKEGEALVADPTATYWQWFMKTLQYLATVEWNKLSTHEKADYGSQQNGMQFLRNQILERINKITKVPLVMTIMTSTKPFLKKDCKAYWTQYGLQWTTISNLEEKKEQGHIKWNPEIKEWLHNTATLQIWIVRDGTKTIFDAKLVPYIPKTRKLYQICNMCDQYWHKTAMIYNKWIEETVCPKCNIKHQSTPTNADHNFQSIFSNYHSHRAWKFYNQRLNKGDEQSLPIGIECEMGLKSGISGEIPPTMWKLYQFQIDHNPQWHNFYTESDGSLGNSGVEMITNPMTLELHHQYWEVMLPEMRKYLRGWDAVEKNGGTSYGIHLTFHRKYWRDYHLARLIKFTEDIQNQDFVHAIAQRRVLYGGNDIAMKDKPLLRQTTVVV
jgi:hypothetical protein